MIPMLDTYASETVEYVRSLGIVKVVVVVAGFIGLTAALVAANWQTASPADTTWWLDCHHRCGLRLFLRLHLETAPRTVCAHRCGQSVY